MFSSRPSLFTSTALPLNVNAVLRAITKAPLMSDKSVVRLSVTPSTKYSCSGSPPMFANGSTTMDRCRARGIGGAARTVFAFRPTAYALMPCGNVDAVTENVITLDQDVPEVNPDPVQHTPVLWGALLTFGHHSLQ